MRKVFFLALILLSNLLCAQNINHLTYKIVTTSSEIKIAKPGLTKECDITINGNLFTMHNREYNGGKLLRESNLLFDLDKNLRILLYNDNAYNIEYMDAIYIVNVEVVGTGETKTINGLKCEKYTLKKTKNASSSFIIDMLVSKYTFWITKDIQLDRRINKAVVKVLTKFLTAEFEGALVQMDYKVTNPKQEVPSDISMDVKESVKIDEAMFEMPWKSGDKKAVIQDPMPRSMTSTGSAVTTSEELKECFRRQKELLAKVTGQEDPKYIVRDINSSE